MANLNLSEFGEKLFVADADHTFIWDTANSISKRVSRNSWLNSGTLTSDAPVTISQTWNNAAVAFTGLKFNAAGTSGTNSAAASLLLDLQVGGVSKFKVDRLGSVTLNNASGLFYSSSNRIRLGNNSSDAVEGLFIADTSYIGFINGGDSNAASNSKLYGEATNTLALRNGAAAQTFRIYNTFPGTGNNEFGSLNWVDQPNEFQITTGQAGGGTGRALCLRAGGGINIRIGGAPGTLVWQFGISTGHFLAGSDNSVDIGASGANRPRNVYVANNVTVGNTLSTSICDVTAIRLAANGSGCVIRQDSNGIIRLSNNGETDFTRLQFGASTDAGPAIARDGAGIKFTGAAAGSTSWIKVPPVAVSALPVATTAGAGARAFVNDALSPVFGSAVANGGSAKVPVYSDGSAWYVG